MDICVTPFTNPLLFNAAIIFFFFFYSAIHRPLSEFVCARREKRRLIDRSVGYTSRAVAREDRLSTDLPLPPHMQRVRLCECVCMCKRFSSRRLNPPFLLSLLIKRFPTPKRKEEIRDWRRDFAHTQTLQRWPTRHGGGGG